MSEGKPQWITHLKTHFNCTVHAVLQIFNSLLFPPGIFQPNTLYIFICDEGRGKKMECVFPPAGKQPNHFNYIPNGCNLHIATSPVLCFWNFHSRLDFLWANEIFPHQQKEAELKGGTSSELCYRKIQFDLKNKMMGLRAFRKASEWDMIVALNIKLLISLAGLVFYRTINFK